MGENTYGNTTTSQAASQPANNRREQKERCVERLGITESGLRLRGMRNGYMK